MLPSLPLWECGLKLIGVLSNHSFVVVTPFVGVWIEIYHVDGTTFSKSVTPFVGVWIEITVSFGMISSK